MSFLHAIEVRNQDKWLLCRFLLKCSTTQPLLQRRGHGDTGIFQRQWRYRFDDAGQAHKAAAAFAAASQACSSGVQIVEGILPVVNGRNDLVNFSIARSCYGCLFRHRRLNQITGEVYILVLAHNQRGLAVGLQLHRAAGGCDDLRICRNTHAFTDGCEVAVAATNPCLASELGNENGLCCHDDLPLPIR